MARTIAGPLTRGTLRVRWLFEPADAWWGVFARRRALGPYMTWQLYVCVVPFLPVLVERVVCRRMEREGDKTRD